MLKTTICITENYAKENFCLNVSLKHPVFLPLPSTTFFISNKMYLIAHTKTSLLMRIPESTEEKTMLQTSSHLRFEN